MSPAPIGNDPGRQSEDDVAPDNPVDIPPMIVDSSDGDSAEENIAAPEDPDNPPELNGYQLLPQSSNVPGDQLEIDDQSDEDSEEETEGAGSGEVIGWDMEEEGPDLDAGVEHESAADSGCLGYEVLLPEHLQNKCRAEDVERRELWRSSLQEKTGLQMDQEHTEKIKSIMSTISLPPGNVPSWAGVIPEEEWKARLISRLHASENPAVQSGCGASPTAGQTLDAPANGEPNASLPPAHTAYSQ